MEGVRLDNIPEDYGDGSCPHPLTTVDCFFLVELTLLSLIFPPLMVNAPPPDTYTPPLFTVIREAVLPAVPRKVTPPSRVRVTPFPP
jgi:hypothetical protein